MILEAVMQMFSIICASRGNKPAFAQQGVGQRHLWARLRGTGKRWDFSSHISKVLHMLTLPGGDTVVEMPHHGRSMS